MNRKAFILWQAIFLFLLALMGGVALATDQYPLWWEGEHNDTRLLIQPVKFKSTYGVCSNPGAEDVTVILSKTSHVSTPTDLKVTAFIYPQIRTQNWAGELENDFPRKNLGKVKPSNNSLGFSIVLAQQHSEKTLRPLLFNQPSFNEYRRSCELIPANLKSDLPDWQFHQPGYYYQTMMGYADNKQDRDRWKEYIDNLLDWNEQNGQFNVLKLIDNPITISNENNRIDKLFKQIWEKMIQQGGPSFLKNAPLDIKIQLKPLGFNFKFGKDRSVRLKKKIF